VTHAFDKDYWESHWQEANGGELAANPYVARETANLAPGTALDAGCGEGAEAIWLATRGWVVTAADISTAVLARAASRAGPGGVQWVEADLSVWEPDERFDLVMTHYAHAALPQLMLYERLAGWVAPGGTLLIVGHGPAVTAASVTEVLDDATWDIVTAEEPSRSVADRTGRTVQLDDVVVRATRHSFVTEENC
jgi:SAM-dependent methyltransferase